MQYLQYSQITGSSKKDVANVRRLFGGVYFGGSIFEPAVMLAIIAVLPNIYRSKDLKKDKDALIYVVVPDKKIENVWVERTEDINQIKLGTATDGKRVLTQAFAVIKGMTTLYLCLSHSGCLIDETHSLGI
jgi:hypothetical protein